MGRREPGSQRVGQSGFCALPIGLVVISNLFQGTAIDWLEIAVYTGSLALIGGIFWFAVIMARTDRDPRIIVTKTHLHLPKKQEAPLAWSEIRALEIHRGSGKYGRHQRILAVITKRNNQAEMPKRTWLERMFVKWHGTLLTEELERLEGEPKDVYGAIARLAPPDLLAVSDAVWQLHQGREVEDAGL